MCIRDRHLSTRAVVLFKLGELELATRDFEGAASLIPDHPGVYADLLLPAVTHGHAQLAQLVYSRAMSRESIDPELRLYFSLWMADLQPRSGAAPDRRIDDYLREYPGEDWAKSLARHSLGELSYEELLSDADTPGRKAEAHFYEGLRQARDGKARAALKLMEAVLETGMMGFFEYEMAQQYLVWGEVPAKPRAALETAGS